MGVKSDKTYEEIVEHFAALFKLKPGPDAPDCEGAIEIGPTLSPANPLRPAGYADSLQIKK